MFAKDPSDWPGSRLYGKEAESAYGAGDQLSDYLTLPRRAKVYRFLNCSDSKSKKKVAVVSQVGGDCTALTVMMFNYCVMHLLYQDCVCLQLSECVSLGELFHN